MQGHYVVREALEVQAALRFAAFATPRERFELKSWPAALTSWAPSPIACCIKAMHLKPAFRIAQNARCPASGTDRENARTRVDLACVLRQPRPTDPTTPTELADALCSGESHQVADAVRQHLAVAMIRSMEVLQPNVPCCGSSPALPSTGAIAGPEATLALIRSRSRLDPGRLTR